jgi:ABC-type nitrate/sulfonate/bicarbonate transport system permease component
MSELTRLSESRKRYAKEWKIVSWTLGMALAVFLITDGKTTSKHALRHLLIGAALGFVLGLLFTWNPKAKSAVN